MTHRDNMAMQFFRCALRISDAAAPRYPEEQDENGNNKSRDAADQNALDSQLRASQMAIASEYGLLTYLASDHTDRFLFIKMYNTAHKACLEAFDQAKDLRHSPIDAEFAEVCKGVVDAIGVYYNKELAVWTEPVKAEQEKRLPKLTPDTYIAEHAAQRKQHAAADLDKMIRGEQARLGKLVHDISSLGAKVEALNKSIDEQAQVTRDAEEKYEKAKDEMDALRKELEKQSGRLSEISAERSDLRSKLAVVDGDHFVIRERLQTLVNLRAQAQ
jgi:predicted  nucleic acid-binding Zn-ribbon protein